MGRLKTLFLVSLIVSCAGRIPGIGEGEGEGEGEGDGDGVGAPLCSPSKDGRQTIVGSFVVTRPSQLARFAGCEEIDGSLTVNLDDDCSFQQSDFEALTNLQTITGGLTLTGQPLCIAGPRDLSAFSSLSNVQALTISGVGSLLAIDLPDLVAGGLLRISDLPQLEVLHLPKVQATDLEILHLQRLASIDLSSTLAERVELIALGVGPTLNLAPLSDSVIVDRVPDVVMETQRIAEVDLKDCRFTSHVDFIGSVSTQDAAVLLPQLNAVTRADFVGGRVDVPKLTSAGSLSFEDVVRVQLPLASSVGALVLQGGVSLFSAPLLPPSTRLRVERTLLTELTLPNTGSHIIIGNGPDARGDALASPVEGDLVILGNPQLASLTLTGLASEALVIVDNDGVSVTHPGGFSLRHAELERAELPFLGFSTIEFLSVTDSQVDLVFGDVLDFRRMRPLSFRLPLSLEGGEILVGDPFGRGNGIEAISHVSASRFLDLDDVALSEPPSVGPETRVNLLDVTFPNGTDLSLTTRNFINIGRIQNLRSLRIGGIQQPSSPPGEGEGEGEGEPPFLDLLADRTSVSIRGVDVELISVDWTSSIQSDVFIRDSQVGRVVFPNLATVQESLVTEFVNIQAEHDGPPIPLELPRLRSIVAGRPSATSCRGPSNFIDAGGSVFAPLLTVVAVDASFDANCSISLVSSPSDVAVTVNQDFVFDLQGEGAASTPTTLLRIVP